MGIAKGIIYICIALVLTNIITQGDRELIKKIPFVGESIANIKNLNLYIIIVTLTILVFII